jgi:SPP1 gp7 family putative phage head morphogenesis protein
MSVDPEIAALFGKPAREVVDYLERKRKFSSEGWETVSAIEHQRGFTVAQTAGFNVLGDIYDALQRARDEGWSHKEFKERLEPVLRAKGWWGKAVDPETGEILKTYPGTSRPVKYGSPARLRLIYDTNMATGYGAGRFERQTASRATHPYLRYVAVMDLRTRRSHAALNGEVWPADHPFWQINYPPNGYRCRCTAQSLTRRDVEAEGIEVNEGGEPLSRLTRVNARGDVMPQRGWATTDGRKFWADPGFGVAPGNTKEALTRLGASFERLPETAWGAAAKALSFGEAFAAWRKNPEGNFPIAQVRQRDANLIGHKGSRILNLSSDSMKKQDREDKHGEITNEEYALVQETVLNSKPIRNGERTMIYVYEKGNQIIAVKTTKAGDELFLTSLRRLSHEQAQRDSAIRNAIKWRKREK